MDQKVSHIAMWIIGITLVVCVAIVLVFKGVDAMPFGWIGVVVALVLAIAAFAMTRLHFEDPHASSGDH
jgi:hypothetical protein